MMTTGFEQNDEDLAYEEECSICGYPMTDAGDIWVTNRDRYICGSCKVKHGIIDATPCANLD